MLSPSDEPLQSLNAESLWITNAKIATLTENVDPYHVVIRLIPNLG